MKKSEAVTIFGSASQMAEALQITPQAVSQWAEELPQRRIDWVVGAAWRLGLIDRVASLHAPPTHAPTA